MTRAKDARMLSVLVALIVGGWTLPATGSDRFSRKTMTEYGLVMGDDPERPSLAYGRTFPNGLKELWLKGMSRPDPEFRRMLVDSITMAHHRGMEDTEKVQARLLSLLRDPDPNLEVTRAVVAAMVAMDASDYADRLGRMAIQSGPTIGEIVEPALARWKSPVMKDIWLKRLQNASEGETTMTLAINGLAALTDDKNSDRAAAAMQALVRSNSQPVSVRLAAARGVGQLGVLEADKFVEETANASDAIINSIMVIELLGTRDDEYALKMLKSMMGKDPAVQSRALARLFEIDPMLVDVEADRLAKSPDAGLRTWAARGMIETGSWDRIADVSVFLNDTNHTLRREVALGLMQLAESESLRPQVIKATTIILNDDQWQGCEQAAFVLSKLDHEPAGPRLVELLGHPRGEVNVAAAWGLKQLRDKSLLPDMLEHAQSVYVRAGSGTLARSLSQAHLFESFGQQAYKPAVELLQKYLPRNFDLGEEARPAAAWALGLILAEQPEHPVAPLLLERLNDIEGPVLETELMREMSAISLGRMKAELALGSLRKYVAVSDLGYACYWAIEQMTGRKPPEVEPPTVRFDDWFLKPLKKRR